MKDQPLTSLLQAAQAAHQAQQAATQAAKDIAARAGHQQAASGR